jgi:prophage tail gpP-like protein
MADNNVYISVGGENFTGWTSIKIRRSLEALTSTFELNVTDKTNQKENLEWPIRPQDECIIRIGRDKLITGYVDTVVPTIDATTHGIKISGRDKTSDIVDCSYTGTKNSFSKKSMTTLAKTLVEPFGINVKLDPLVDDTELFQFTVNRNDTIFTNLNKKANNLGMLLVTNADGDLVITNSGSRTLEDTLEFGRNIHRASMSYDYTNRFSEYIVNAQSLYKQGKGTWGNNIKVKATSTDEGVKRYRPKLIKPGSPLSRTMAQDHANWEALIRAAKSEVLNVTTTGFRQASGLLWDINYLVSVYIPPMYVNPAIELLISAVEYTIDDFGSFTKMVLKRPDAYKSKPAKAIKASSLSLGWDRLNIKTNK